MGKNTSPWTRPDMGPSSLLSYAKGLKTELPEDLRVRLSLRGASLRGFPKTCTVSRKALDVPIRSCSLKERS